MGNKGRRFGLKVTITTSFMNFTPALAVSPSTAAPLSAKQDKIIEIAAKLLDQAQVSYVYGGSELGDGSACTACNTCLTTKMPKPSHRFAACPVCASCSLDCSHFTELVFRQAGVPYPYLDTRTMQSLQRGTLLSRYGLLDLGTDLLSAQVGDLLVYTGHVSLLEHLYPMVRGEAVRGDIIHATGGKDIRRPGEGIQRERFADLAHFRGPLKRILRHRQLASSGRDSVHHLDRLPQGEGASVHSAVTEQAPATTIDSTLSKLRPVMKRQVDDGG